MIDKAFWNGRRVFVTGHTGFKGSWLCIWLRELGARVAGYSLDPPTQPNNFEASRLAERLTDLRGDVRELASLRQAMEAHEPQVVTSFRTGVTRAHEPLWQHLQNSLQIGEFLSYQPDQPTFWIT